MQEERAKPDVPRWGGEGRGDMGPGDSHGLLRWLSSSHQIILTGSMLPSSAALGKCRESQAPWTEVASPKALVRAWLGAECSCVNTCGSVNIPYPQLRHLWLFFRICVGFQQQLTLPKLP